MTFPWYVPAILFPSFVPSSSVKFFDVFWAFVNSANENGLSPSFNTIFQVTEELALFVRAILESSTDIFTALPGSTLTLETCKVIAFVSGVNDAGILTEYVIGSII